MFGFVYRLGVAVREKGERMAHGGSKCRWCSGPVIGIGKVIRGIALGLPIG